MSNLKTATARRLQNRDKLEADILAEAVRVFAESGYEGASIATVAENAGLSKQNLMYYFPTKQALYQRVLDGVLDEWLARMDSLADPRQDPSHRRCGLLGPSRLPRCEHRALPEPQSDF